MLERRIVEKIKKYLKEQGATVHKYHGGFGGATGHSDLYGTLKDGRAYFIEVKSPTAKRDKNREATQRMFLLREHLNGAVVGFAMSVEDAGRILSGEEILWPQR